MYNIAVHSFGGIMCFCCCSDAGEESAAAVRERGRELGEAVRDSPVPQTAHGSNQHTGPCVRQRVPRNRGLQAWSLRTRARAHKVCSVLF